MTLSEIKQQLGYSQFNLNTVETATGEKTQWSKHWDNTNRIAVLIHKDTLAKLRLNMDCSSLGIKTAIKQGSLGEYKAHTIVMYSEAEEIL